MTRLEEINQRKIELRDEIENLEDETKVEEINQEIENLNSEAEELEKHNEETEVAKEMEEKKFVPKEIKKMEERKMENSLEFRNSKEYINAYAEYVKGEKDAKELRALLTTNAGTVTGSSSTVEVPDMIYDIVKTAWNREELMSRVRRISVKGNLKVQFEVSGGDAQIHAEGGDPVTEESLVLGVVSLTPQSIKKWISISDEVLDMRGEEFLNYIYDEITYRIAKKCADILVAKIAALPQSLTANSDGVYDKVSAAKITTAPALSAVAQGIGNLSDEATRYTIVMNKLTYIKFKEAQYAAGYPVDPFEGIDVVYNNTLPAYDTASAGDVYMILGDFDHGSLANFPDGDGIEMKYDDKTQMTSDLVRILGRRYVAVDAVADKSFALFAKPTSA